MDTLQTAHAPSGRGPWRRVAADGAFAAAVVAVAIGLAAVASLPLPVAGAAVLLVTGSVLWRFYSQTPAPSFGLANWVTLFRLDLVALLMLAALPGERPLDTWPLFAIAALALALDGVDGWLARLRQEASPFGERFDMGADTALTITLTVCLLAMNLVGPWVLLIGLLRPAYVLAGRSWPLLAAPLPPSRGRKVACAAALCCLVAGFAPPLATAAPGLALAALGLLVWSFGRDLRYLLRPRAPA